MATELAKAYVQIIPSARGIQGSLTKALGGEAGSAGTSAGQTFGSNLVGKVLGIVSAAAIGKALASTITEGAALEQSIGGIETLFKDSADKVKANAAAAYSTAGMSANQYMEQTTSFAASLLQSLGGDTAAAADMADMAMRDMSDNSNKMGTDMERITDAYQGFAKQNYTMLDNLKLGYGGTKTEMERLLKDAQKITGVKYDINSLADVYSAIHVIQGELDITGTTAKEAATTLSGSFNSMVAAGKNVLGNLTLGQDITPSLQALAQTTTTFLVGNLLPAVWNVLKALPGGMATLVQEMGTQLAAQLPSFLAQFQTGMAGSGQQLLQSGIAMIQNLGQGLAQGIPQFLAQALPLLSQFTGSLRANFGQLVDAGIDLILSLAQGLISALPTLITYVPGIVSNIAGIINDNAPKLLTAAGQLILMLANGLVKAIPTLVANLPQIITAITDVITAFNWVNLGSSVIRMLGNGITGMVGVARSAGQSVMEAVQNAVTGLPGTLQNLGRSAVSQMAGGVRGMLGEAASAAGAVLTGMVNAVVSLPGQLVSVAQSAVSGMVSAFTSGGWSGIGANIINGIIGGIGSAVGGLVSAAVSAAQSAFNAAKNALGIHSPSRLFRDKIGRMIPEGMAVGIVDNLAPVTNAVRQLGQQATATVQTDLYRMLRTPRPRQATAESEGEQVPASFTQNLIFNYPMQAPDEIARAARIEATRGLAGGR